MKLITGIAAMLLALNAGAQDTATHPLPSEESLKQLPVLWQQTAAEYRALCYQAFNIAKLRLEKLVKTKKKSEHWAIVTDLDETILDNSYAEAELIRQNKEFNGADWKNWVSKAAATEVPGASQFLQWVHTQGISVFYISNRDSTQLDATISNLKKLQLPDADLAHCMFSVNTPSKETRRKAVMAKYKVVMLLGDNLNDFTSLFEYKNIAERKAEADKAREEWGNKFIVLPNSTYGDWENAIYHYERMKPAQKDSTRKSTLVGIPQ